MKERPIIFSAEMVRAILDGRKTMTRRPIKPQPSTLGDIYQHPEKCYRKDGANLYWIDGGLVKCPYGQVGDRLWVRETWKPALIGIPQFGQYKGVVYKADDKDNVTLRHKIIPDIVQWKRFYDKGEWIPSIYMPRWASRILLEITDIRAERVQDITEGDAMAEGAMAWWSAIPHDKQCQIYNGGHGPIAAFNILWDSLYAKRGYGWATNPWAWARTFKRLQP